ncbi:hypothetical protein NE237_033216 [Protea cynaroides]|uniref:F-box domain-containing protein n=1 Tax=Protea cynaroides TaxID=273540 RepID=A0A9Q0R497_9MAGN|nr:hypothetical protein NE237_033216 [Protea cynaroides]
MKQTRDRIGDLPDGILHYILSLLPMKTAVTTGILSRRWRDMWKNTWVNVTKLVFDEEFINAQTQIQFVEAVNRFINLSNGKKNGKKIESFLISFHLHDQHQSSVEKWIEFIILQGIEELDLDFSHGITLGELDDLHGSFIKLPEILFSCNTLMHLNLSLCEFNLPVDFSGFISLETLQLKRVTITDEKLENVIFSCPHLKTLSLIQCFKLHSIRIVGPDLQLKSLKVVHCWNTYEIEILAPNLQSFHFYGDLLYGYSFENVSALVDVFMSSEGFEHTEPEHDYINILSSLSHLKILTICSGPLMYISSMEEYNRDDLPITFPNLKELQLQIGFLNMEYLGYVFSFFKHTLENSNTSDASTKWDLWKPVELPPSCVFAALRTIKIKNFHGSEAEMRLVEFVLEKAFILESLVLVSTHNSYSGGESGDMRKMDSPVECVSQSFQTQLRILEDQLESLPKASVGAKIIILCEEWKDESTPFPTHTECNAELLN